MKVQKHNRRDYKTRIVNSFLATYLLIALIPIVIGITFYTYTLRTVLDNERDKTSVLLSQTMKAMDADLNMARDIMFRIIQSKALNSLLISDSPSSKPSAIMDSMEFCNELKQMYIQDSAIYDVIVYANTPNMLFGARKGHCFIRTDAYYPYFLNIDGITVDEWQELLSNKKSSYFLPARHATLEEYRGGNSIERYLGIHIWPLYRDGVLRGNVMFLLDASKFVEDMGRVIDADAGAVAWIEAQGDIIMSCPENVTLPECDNNYLKVSLESVHNSLRYNIMVPKRIIFEKVMWLRNLIILMTILSVIIGFAAAIIFARRLGAPLDRISANLQTLYAQDSAKHISKIGKRMSPLTQLGDSINELILKHTQLSNYVSRQINVLDQLFFEKLLGGYFNDESQVHEMLGYISQPKLQEPLILALIRMERMGDVTVSEASEMNACRAEAFATEMKSEHLMFETSLDTCVLIFSLNSESEDEIESQFNSVIARINSCANEKMAMRAIGVLSLPVMRYIELSKVYARCSELIYSCAENTEGILLYQKNVTQKVYSYSLDVENQLVNFVLSGNREKVHELIMNAFGMERNRGHLAQSQRMLTQSMCATIIRISQLMDVELSNISEIDDLACKLATIKSSSDALDIIISNFDSIIDRVQERQRGRTDTLMQLIKEYVDENFTDSNVNLSSTATKFSLNDAYLSRTFKEYAGCNFSVYLERKRIDGALKLMNKKMSLDEIALQTGFEHVYNLRSAFKRTFGVTPSEYRKRINNNDTI